MYNYSLEILNISNINIYNFVTNEYFKYLKKWIKLDFVKPESEATIHEVIDNPETDHECVGSIVLYHILNTDSSDGKFKVTWT
jgi:hypothetical protein